MSIHPELAEFPKEAVAAPIIGYARTQLQGRNNGWHSHDAAQLFHVIRGSIAIDTEMGTYFVPPERAVWLPPRVSHQTRYLTDTELRYIYVQYDYTRDLPQTPQVMQVTTLLRALILEFMSYPRSETDKGPAARIAAVILDQLKMLPVAPCSYRCRRMPGCATCAKASSDARHIFPRSARPRTGVRLPCVLSNGA